ncbi:MAG TPA: LTA synthase family protein [Candidatus Eisenbergiella intestinigallinarum]|uniref:LTA synthase family protein n=1 Tax=Candidatus Eisenbergiella intestinigallinarum TaxID=2838549 RepID=A0A9D2QIG2_9FIRM|nr:LTA synthase family protein [Candidatus Eisenbergiella intestinigallinarum]
MKKVIQKIRESRLSLIMLFIAPAATFYLLEWYTHNPFETMKTTPQVLNLIMFELLALLLFSVFGKLHVALMAETLFFAIYGLANYFVLNFRSVPIQPWDLLSIGTAASVAGNYDYTLDRQALLVVLGFLFLLILEFFCRFTLKKGTWKLRLPMAATLVVMLGAFGLMFHSDEIVEQKLRLYNKLFTPTTISYKNGTALAFVMELRYLSVDKPAGYNADTAAQELAALEEESMSEPAMAGAGSDEGEFPNIIVIMDEAFSDPAILGDFTVNQDYMPFVHSLLDGAENTVSGWLNVSVLGGNTANTEFEYLTGNTMAFLPQGSIPYQQYIKGETPSLASHLAGLGYQTVAMHPYNASGWDRDTVYPAMGFSEMYFLPDFDNAAKVRNYVSDQSDFEKIVEIYENKGDNPLFLFNVTMQNHSSYTESFDNFDPQIEVEGGSQTLNNYLSLLSLSDAALGELISYFEEQEEDTIIVFFGDHQTTNSVIEPILKQNGKSSSTLTEEEQADRYKVPFFIWANFDIEEENGVETSVNYLGAKTLLAAGVPMDGYFTYLSVFSETVPVISANHVTLADGTFTNADDQSELLSDYKGYQYYRLFDYSAD